MKKLFVMIAMLSFTVSQDSGMSLYGGLNLTRLACDNGCDDGDALTSFAIGAQKNMGSFVLGAGISGRGMKQEKDGGITYSQNYMYLDLHALKPFSIGPGALFAGLDLGMNLSAKTKAEGCPAGLEGCGESDIEDVQMDYGLMLGYSFPINEKMSVYASYYHGLAEIIKDWETTHTGIGLGLGYGL